ncbi:transposase [Streptomyces chrestomyceticus]|uniref:transposase n=1 Tax=Streptomyces chrestomyceticus TaxID=68185 RepID=UPI00378C3462
MGQAKRSWIVPDGLWEIAKPLLPPSRVRPQGGGTSDTPSEALFAAIIYVPVSRCAWRHLAPCFGISKATAHRQFLILSRAGVRGQLHEAVLHRLDDAGLVDVTRVVLDTAHDRPKKGGRTRRSEPVARRKPGTKMHLLSDANGLPLVVGVSAANVRDSHGLKPMVADSKRNATRFAAATARPNASMRTRHTTSPTCGDGAGPSAIGVRIARKGIDSSERLGRRT